MGRFIVIVLDSFGVGQMMDVPEVRPHDVGSNTAKHIIKQVPDIHIPNLLQLGLMNTIGEDIDNFRSNPQANIGRSELKHHGADSFLGHQEIMGTNPPEPLNQPFSEMIDEVEGTLMQHGYKVMRYPKDSKPQILVVNDCVTIGDNLETDLGQVFNVSSALDLIDFSEVKKIGALVRETVKVSRVITFGGEGITLDNLLNAQKTIEHKYAGVDAPESGVYKKGYQVVHMGYGINPKVQIQSILENESIPVVFGGKVADIIQTQKGELYPGVDTEKLFEQFIDRIETIKHGFFCLNVQETDLAGHGEDVIKYAKILEIADQNIGKIITMLNENDYLIITADHGNDPTIGHSQHTREYVPVLIYNKDISSRDIGIRKTMSDTAATVADYFGTNMPQDGESYLKDIVVE